MIKRVTKIWTERTKRRLGIISKHVGLDFYFLAVCQPACFSLPLTYSVRDDITGVLHTSRFLNVRKFPKFTRTKQRAPDWAQTNLLFWVSHFLCLPIRWNWAHVSVSSQVSTGGRHSKKTQSLLSCNRKVLNMAENTPAIHLQFTEYYFPHSAGGPGTSDISL